MTGVMCPLCGTEMTVKDNGVWSSCLCACRICIFYYESCSDLVVTKQEWLENKKREAERLSKKLETI
jgi:hypothetical protein